MKNITQDDIDQCNDINSLEELKTEIINNIEDVTFQVQSARAEAVDGYYSDPKWYASAKRAVTMKRRIQRQITLKLKKLNENISQSRDKDLIQALREHVGEKVFLEICEVVQ